MSIPLINSLRQKKIFYIIIPFIITCIVSIFLTLFVHKTDISFFSVETGHEKVFSEKAYLPIHNKHKVVGTVQARENNFGIISIPFFASNTRDIIIFRLKADDNKLIHEAKYNSKELGGYVYFPFGFNAIANSKGKNYSFEITSVSSASQTKNLVAIAKKNPQIRTRYVYSKDFLIQNPHTLASFLLNKTTSTFSNTSSIIAFCAIYVVILIFYFTLIKKSLFKRKKTPVFLFSKKFSIGNLILKNRTLIIILFIGIIPRIILSTIDNYNFDMLNFIKDAAIFRNGYMNVYAHQESYNYSPIMFFILGFLDIIQRFLPTIPFYTILRIFISLVDVATAIVLFKIAQNTQIHPLRTVSLFFLNPVTIILSGFHAQFDNIAIFFLLLTILIYQNTKHQKLHKGTLWGLATLGLVIKHIIFVQIFLFYTYLFSKNKFINASILFALSIIVFFLTFVPFFAEARETIINNVFRYTGLINLTGFTYILNELCKGCVIANMPITEFYKNIFIIVSLLFAYMISGRNILRSTLLSILFFLTFSSSIAAQYLILPMSLGAFFPTKWFYMYSIIITAYLLGNSAELNISAFNLITISTVWVFSSLWFISELLLFYPVIKKRLLPFL